MNVAIREDSTTWVLGENGLGERVWVLDNYFVSWAFPKTETVENCICVGCGNEHENMKE